MIITFLISLIIAFLVAFIFIKDIKSLEEFFTIFICATLLFGLFSYVGL